MAREGPARISVRVQPGAGRSELVGFQDGAWRIRIAAPPVKGKANQELVRFLSDILGLARGNLIIEEGLTSRRKVISVGGLTPAQVTGQLEKAAKER